MNMILSTIYEQAAIRPDAIALHGSDQSVSYRQMTDAITRLGRRLETRHERVIGLLMDNCPAWAIIDLAAQYANCTLVPLPIFFSNRQLQHIIADAGIEIVLTDQPQRLATLTHRPMERYEVLAPELSCHIIAVDSKSADETTVHNKLAGISKITYTSGSTGKPKGVCLSLGSIETVVQSLASVIAVTSADRHGSLLPLSTLLENLAGLYVPLLNGAGCVLQPTRSLGTDSAAQADGRQLLAHLDQHRCTSTLLVPQLLQLLLGTLQHGATVPETLRFVALGGAPVAADYITRARRFGLPVYEGYGLSEATSVVSVNSPDHDQPGSVGRPLPHCTVKIADDGEILVRGALFDGYLHQPAPPLHDGLLATGDLGYLDARGFLHINGRKKNLIITSNGRNISPEWIEKELITRPHIQLAMVFGDQLPHLCAVIWPSPGGKPAQIAAAIAAVNRQLPEYARIHHWQIGTVPPGLENHQLSETGTLNRQRIREDYQAGLLQRDVVDQTETISAA